MTLRLEQADIKLTVSEFVAARIFLALALGCLPLLYLGTKPIGLAAMAAIAFVGYLFPSFYLSFARGRRISRLEAQLVEALSLISNSIKAGFGLMQSLDLASREMTHPIATEIRRTLYDVNVGAATEDAFHNFAKRCGSDDIDIVVTAMMIQQSTGGNLSEILDNVAHTMRERIRIRGEIKTLTTQQLLTGFIVGGLPFAMMGLFSVLNPLYMMPLFTETVGNLMLIAAGGLELFGILVIKKILQIEV
jgi:tight adherence protein B